MSCVRLIVALAPTAPSRGIVFFTGIEPREITERRFVRRTAEKLCVGAREGREKMFARAPRDNSEMEVSRSARRWNRDGFSAGIESLFSALTT